MRFLHSMLRTSDPAATVAFFQLLGLEERRRHEVPQGKFTLIFLGVPGDDGGEVDDIYALCAKLQAAGVTINRPPRDGRMAFVRSPDSISVELLQKGAALAPAEPWASMPNTGEW
jgi:lactoylglutathione lyase